ncbi:MAG: SagB family peptide dehydrogenase [Egibacteraceae bacterium]
MEDHQAPAHGSIGLQYVRVGESRPIPDKVDWANAPSQFKLYRGCPKIPLGDHANGERATSTPLTFEQLGQLLRDVYGLTRQGWTAPDELVSANPGGNARFHLSPPTTLRPVPAGGARYPCELYLLAGRGQPLPAGVYHYDPAHHCLDTIHDGDHTRVLATSLRTYVETPQDGVTESRAVAHQGVSPLQTQGRPVETPQDGVTESRAVAHQGVSPLQTQGRPAEPAQGTHSGPVSTHGLCLLITIAFWKNVFKYGEFSYRLHSLDAGVVIGQALAVCARHELPTTVHFQFLDAELDRLLELDSAYESVYAVITLTDSPAADQEAAGADALLDDQPTPVPQPAAPHHEVNQTQSIGLYPLPAKLHEVSMQQGSGPWPLGDSLPPALADAPASVRSLPLPLAPLDLLEGLRRRRSSRGFFSPGPLTGQQLAGLLSPSLRGYSSDLGGDESAIQHTMLFCAVHDVDGIDSGVYYYDPTGHTLEQVSAGDVRAELQAAVTSWMFNLFQVNLCFFPVANYERRLSVYGDRWYRVQNMEAGIIVQRLYLAAAALGLGCHTQLGFRVDAVNTLLGLGDSPLTSLIQVLIAPPHESGRSYEYKL